MAKRELRTRLEELFTGPPESAPPAASPAPEPGPTARETQAQQPVPASPPAAVDAGGVDGAVLLNSVRSPLLALKRDLTILYCNDAYAELARMPAGPIAGKHLLALFPQHAQTALSAAYEQALATGESEVVEAPFGERHLRWSVYPAPFGLVSIAEDITERRQAEMELVRRTQDLETINQASQSLSNVSGEREVLDQVASVIGQLFGGQSLTVAAFDPPTQRLTFPLHIESGERYALPPRLLANGVADYVIRTQTPLLPEDVVGELRDAGIDLAGSAPHSLLAVPMVVGARVTGAIVIQDFEQAGVFTHAHVEPLVMIASQAAAALENARLLADVERRAIQLQTAAAVSHAASSILNLDELLPVTAELIRNRFNLYYVGIFLVDEAREYAVLRAGTGAAGRLMLARGHKLAVNGVSMIGWCVANRQARIALDVGQEAVRFENPALPETRSELALPLIARGEMLGAMSVQSTQEAAFSGVDITVLQTMADQVANAIVNAQLFEQAQRRVAELATINSINQALGSQLELGSLMEVVVERLRQFLGVPNAYIALYDAGSDTIEIPYLIDGDERKPVEPFPLGPGFTSHIIRTRQPLLINRDADRMAAELGAKVAGKPARSYLGIPITTGDEMIGVIAVLDPNREDVFSEVEQRLLMTIAPSIGIAIQNARLFAQTQAALAEARHLAERRELTSRIAGRIRAAVSVDEVLRVASEELRQAVHAARVTARLAPPAEPTPSTRQGSPS